MMELSLFHLWSLSMIREEGICFQQSRMRKPICLFRAAAGGTSTNRTDLLVNGELKMYQFACGLLDKQVGDLCACAYMCSGRPSHEGPVFMAV